MHYPFKLYDLKKCMLYRYIIPFNLLIDTVPTSSENVFLSIRD